MQARNPACSPWWWVLLKTSSRVWVTVEGTKQRPLEKNRRDFCGHTMEDQSCSTGASEIAFYLILLGNNIFETNSTFCFILMIPTDF